MELTPQSLEGFNETVGHLEKAAGQLALDEQMCVGVFEIREKLGLSSV